MNAFAVLMQSDAETEIRSVLRCPVDAGAGHVHIDGPHRHQQQQQNKKLWAGGHLETIDRVANKRSQPLIISFYTKNK